MRAVVVAAVFSVGALTLSGCSAISDLFPEEAVRDAETQEISEAGQADVFALAVGDCFNDQAATDVESVPAVPCAEPHHYEAYFSFDLSDAETFPGDDVVSLAAEEGCTDEFAAFIGLPYDQSTLAFTFLTPTEGSWAVDDREILCLALALDETSQAPAQTSGSLAGVAR